METIRAYTTIEQSRKLAEILPLESADMYYPNRIDIKYQGALPIEFKRGNPLLSQEIAAWSLAALLELLPKRLEIVDNVYELSIYLYGLYYWNINNGNLCFEVKDKDNLVDACYEMILKLNELNLL